MRMRLRSGPCHAGRRLSVAPRLPILCAAVEQDVGLAPLPFGPAHDLRLHPLQVEGASLPLVASLTAGPGCGHEPSGISSSSGSSSSSAGGLSSNSPAGGCACSSSAGETSSANSGRGSGSNSSSEAGFGGSSSITDRRVGGSSSSRDGVTGTGSNSSSGPRAGSASRSGGLSEVVGDDGEAAAPERVMNRKLKRAGTLAELLEVVTSDSGSFTFINTGCALQRLVQLQPSRSAGMTGSQEGSQQQAAPQRQPASRQQEPLAPSLGGGPGFQGANGSYGGSQGRGAAPSDRQPGPADGGVHAAGAGDSSAGAGPQVRAPQARVSGAQGAAAAPDVDADVTASCLQLLGQLLRRQADSLDARGVSCALSAYGSLGRCDGAPLAALYRRGLELAPEFSATDCSAALVGIAKLQPARGAPGASGGRPGGGGGGARGGGERRDARAHSGNGGGAQRDAERRGGRRGGGGSGGGGGGGAQPAWQREFTESLLGHTLDMLQEHGEWRSRELAPLAWALERLGRFGKRRRMLLEALMDAVMWRVDAFKPGELCLVMYGYARLRYRLPRQLARICDRLSSQLAQLTPRDAANLMWACARLDFTPPPAVLDALPAAVAGKLHDFKPQELCNLLYAYAHLGQCQQQLLDAAAPAALPRLRDFSAQDLVITLWAYGAAHTQNPEPQHTPSHAALFDAAASELSARLPVLLPGQLAIAVKAYGRAHHQPPAHLLAAMAAAAAEQLEALQPVELCHLLWGFAELGFNDSALFEAAAAHAVQLLQSGGRPLPKVTVDTLVYCCCKAGFWPQALVESAEVRGVYVRSSFAGRALSGDGDGASGAGAWPGDADGAGAWPGNVDGAGTGWRGGADGGGRGRVRGERGTVAAAAAAASGSGSGLLGGQPGMLPLAADDNGSIGGGVVATVGGGGGQGGQQPRHLQRQQPRPRHHRHHHHSRDCDSQQQQWQRQPDAAAPAAAASRGPSSASTSPGLELQPL